MKSSTMQYIEELVTRYPVLEKVKDDVVEALNMLINMYSAPYHGKILVCGNGGSAADSLHIVGELMKSFKIPRPLPENFRQNILKYSHGKELCKNLQMPLQAMSLVCEVGLNTALGNDVEAVYEFAQQVLGYGQKGDILFCISTSGNSENVVCAAEVALAKEINVIALTGATGENSKTWQRFALQSLKLKPSRYRNYICLFIMPYVWRLKTKYLRGESKCGSNSFGGGIWYQTAKSCS